MENIIKKFKIKRLRQRNLITIPKVVSENWNLQEGDSILFSWQEDSLLLTPVKKVSNQEEE